MAPMRAEAIASTVHTLNSEAERALVLDCMFRPNGRAGGAPLLGAGRAAAYLTGSPRSHYAALNPDPTSPGDVDVVGRTVLIPVAGLENTLAPPLVALGVGVGDG